MDLRILDLDGSLRCQPLLVSRFKAAIHDFRAWGPRIRLGCGFRRFEQFESALAGALGSVSDENPALSFLGSGDFHHVTLALLRRIHQPFNLLVLDNHPDWMRGIPFLHCGTWVHHATQLANLRTVFHIGGNVDFDNAFRRLAPWPALRCGKIHVVSALRRLQRGAWSKLGFPALRVAPDRPAAQERITLLVEPFRAELKRWPLYISLDKDVLTVEDAVVNWDSGHLTMPEVRTLLRAFLDAANRQLAGMDVIGDWSPVRLQGWGRRLLHLTEHPGLSVVPGQAAQCNQRINVELLRELDDLVGGLAEEPELAGLAAD